MKRIRPFVACVFLSALFLRPMDVVAAEPLSGTFVHGNTERTYYLWLPERTAFAPLVVLLHGYGGSAEGYMPAVVNAALRHGFALCAPQGLKDPKGKPSWNVGYPMQEGWEVDDVDFIMQLCRHLQERYGLSTCNIFLTGMSNGGEMCYLFAWQHPEFFTAIASMAGLTMEWLLRESDFGGAVPFMEVHGTADKTSLWDGDPENRGGWGAYISVPVAVSHIAAKNRCTSLAHTELPLLHPEKPSRLVTLHHYSGGTGGAEVLFYEVAGGGHSWALDDIDTPEIIMNFFESWIGRR
jgi:polyhydroxybutyrate depolymerase